MDFGPNYEDQENLLAHRRWYQVDMLSKGEVCTAVILAVDVLKTVHYNAVAIFTKTQLRQSSCKVKTAV